VWTQISRAILRSLTTDIVTFLDENVKFIRVNFNTALRGYSWIRMINSARRNPPCNCRSMWRVHETDEDFHKLIRFLAVVNDDVTLFVSHIYETFLGSFTHHCCCCPAVNRANIWASGVPLRSSLVKFFLFQILFPRGSTVIRFESLFLLVYLSSSIVVRYHGSYPPRRTWATAWLSNRHNNSVCHS